MYPSTSSNGVIEYDDTPMNMSSPNYNTKFQNQNMNFRPVPQIPQMVPQIGFQGQINNPNFSQSWDSPSPNPAWDNLYNNTGEFQSFHRSSQNQYPQNTGVYKPSQNQSLYNNHIRYF